MTTYDKSPYKNIPPELRAKYTMNGKISNKVIGAFNIVK